MGTKSSTAPWTLWPANRLAALFDFAASSNRRAVLLLALVSLIAFLPGIFQIPPVDRDEARFAQATKQMIETGDYVDIRFQDEARYKKPVGIYWLQAAVVKTGEALGISDARTSISLYRMPSLVGAVGAVLATYWCALAFVSRRGAALAALMMAGSTLLGVEARLAKTDAMLLFTVVAAMGALARAYLAQHDGKVTRLRWIEPAVFWTALAGGILLKGPLIVMIVATAAATLAILDRSARWLKALRPLPGLAWLVLLVLPWFLAIYARAGSSFFAGSIGHDLLGKVASGQEAHGAPPGLYFILFFATFFPASMLAGLAAPAVWAVRREPAARFLLAWLVPSWIVFELIVTKLPHYVLPLYPAIAILIAAAVETRVLSQRRWLVRGVMWWFLVPIIVIVVMIIAAIMLARDPVVLAWPFLAAAIVCGLLAWQLYEEDGAERALTRAIASSVLMGIAIYALIVPALGPLFPSVTLAGVLRQSTCAHPLAASAGFGEPSLVFLAGTATRLTDANGAADFLHEGGCRFAFIESRQEHAFALRAEAIGLHYERGPRIEAFNLSIGQPITIAVFQSAEGAP
ncbi:MAG TPA: glycosyltransferase family 39 protein [Xanthobacteraceae bacterium]|nr:glycosyltransferase family 39 protein [Xanthobacteraceae bacterium]